MSQLPLLLHHSPAGHAAPATVHGFAERRGFAVVDVASDVEVIARMSRAYPAAIILDGSGAEGQALQLCRQLKSEPFTAVVPVIVYVESEQAEAAAAALEAGADEVLAPGISGRVGDLRLELALRRAERDVSVHPTTRLPGTVQIERDIAERLRRGEKFAVCYADLDHFKEFNDRYGYHHGDRIILIVSRILRDVVRAHSSRGFIGHIGGDDFIFSVPLATLHRCCKDVLAVFEELVALQYTEEDRQRGWFLGKDRRGNEYEVPLMTLSIGVVTNERRKFSHTAEISELATEMKAYAKTLPGSIYVVDRRTGKRRGEDDGAAS
jgi:diguanylate cyclase (GGDEF)-like protein